MSITDELRESFDQCTYKAGVAPNEFDTVWITKVCALSMLDDIDAAFEAGHSRAVEYGKKIGRGTCQMEYAERPTQSTLDAMGVYFCSECGSPTYNDCMPRYCIYCGAEVGA